MLRKIEVATGIVALFVILLIASSHAEDYDGETETAITGLSDLSGLGGLSALANGIVTGYAPMGPGSGDMSSEMIYQGPGDRGLGVSESSDSESGDYDEDSNESAASEERPISKFINFISGGRHKRSIDAIEPADSKIHSRVKRGYKGWVPYVSTYVKTDKKAHFKWGVKAKVGKKYGK